MQGFLHPESVAVFGVSDTPANLGRVIIGNLERFGFKGAVFPVGASGGSIAGRTIYRGVEELPAVPGLAVLLITAKEVPATLEACGAKGVRYAIVETGGFSELTEDKRATERASSGSTSPADLRPACSRGVLPGYNTYMTS